MNDYFVTTDRKGNYFEGGERQAIEEARRLAESEQANAHVYEIVGSKLEYRWTVRPDGSQFADRIRKIQA